MLTQALRGVAAFVGPASDFTCGSAGAAVVAVAMMRRSCLTRPLSQD